MAMGYLRQIDIVQDQTDVNQIFRNFDIQGANQFLSTGRISDGIEQTFYRPQSFWAYTHHRLRLSLLMAVMLPTQPYPKYHTNKAIEYAPTRTPLGCTS